jgi:hypothetical protein
MLVVSNFGTGWVFEVGAGRVYAVPWAKLCALFAGLVSCPTPPPYTSAIMSLAEPRFISELFIIDALNFGTGWVFEIVV